MTSPHNDNGPGESPKAAVTPDADLVRAVRRGEKQAFVEIVARHQAMVCGLALGILGDFAASEDAGQEAFLTAWRKLDELRDPERLRPWLAQIARNAALGHLRKRRENDPLEGALELADQSPLPDEVTANEEETALVRTTLSQLPETYRLPLILFYRENQSVRAVAEALGVSEEAVKQRLARGREMVRDRMAGLIENVLTRHRPTAVFTMSVAVAIGALTAPAAVASGVFTATSITGAVSSTAVVTSSSTSTPLLTVMSTSKTFLAVTALVAAAFIPVGYNLSRSPQTPATENPVAQVAAETRMEATSPRPTFENSLLFVEWRELHDKHGTNAAAMPALYKAIADLKDPFRRRAFHAALIAEWVQLDAENGLKFYLGKGPDSNQRRQFIEEWLALDAPAAVDALLKSEPGWERVVRDSLSEIARRLPSRIAELVERLPKVEDYWDTNIRDAFGIVAERDLRAARKWVEAMTGPNREEAIAGVAQSWAKSDFKSAMAWARGLPEGIDRDHIVRAALMGLAVIDPAKALESVSLVPPGGRPAHFADTTGARVLQKAAEANFETTMAWLRQHPGRLSSEDLVGLAHVVTERLNADTMGFLNSQVEAGTLSVLMPAIESALLNQSGDQREAVWEWLKTQPDNETTKALKSEVIGSAGWQDPELALRLMGDLPQTDEGNAQVRQLAQRLLNGGNSMHRFDKLLSEVPDRLRQPLIEEAFDSLHSNIGDPQKWITRLALLPEASQAKGIESIARAWADESPEEAVAWTTTLSPGESRNGAISAIASRWANKDPHGAAEWIAVLPIGVERDRGAESLAVAVAETYPREAWEWALNISDDNRRNRAVVQVAKKMAARDPATAQHWIDNGPFTPEARAELQSVISIR